MCMCVCVCKITHQQMGNQIVCVFSNKCVCVYVCRQCKVRHNPVGVIAINGKNANQIQSVYVCVCVVNQREQLMCGYITAVHTPGCVVCGCPMYSQPTGNKGQGEG